MITWLPISNSLCAFQGNPNPKSTERAVVVGEVDPAFEWPGGHKTVIWTTGDGWTGAVSVEAAQRAVEAALQEKP